MFANKRVSDVPPFVQLVKSLLFAILAYSSPLEFEKDFHSHCPPHYLNNFSEDVDFSVDLKFVEADKSNGGEEDTQCYFWIKNGTAFVAFRGTSSFSDAVADVNPFTDEVGGNKGGRVHQGDYNQFLAVEQQLTEHLSQNSDRYTVIRFVGHSLGGALATIAGAHYSHLFLGKEVVVHTFGSPRVGNKRFCRYFAEHVAEHWRVLNARDPVTMIPLTRNYSHISGHALCMNEAAGTHTVFKDDTAWFLRCGAAVSSVTCCAVAEPHRTALYMEKMCSVAKANEIAEVKK